MLHKSKGVHYSLAQFDTVSNSAALGLVGMIACKSDVGATWHWVAKHGLMYKRTGTSLHIIYSIIHTIYIYTLYTILYIYIS